MHVPSQISRPKRVQARSSPTYEGLASIEYPETRIGLVTSGVSSERAVFAEGGNIEDLLLGVGTRHRSARP